MSITSGKVAIVTYTNFDGDENKILSTHQSVVRAQDFVLKRITRFQKQDDSISYHRTRKGNKITFIVFNWFDKEDPNYKEPTERDALLEQVERYDIYHTKVKA